MRKREKEIFERGRSRCEEDEKGKRREGWVMGEV